MAVIRAVLFDLDGVLVDAPDWHYEALNRALGLFGFTITRKEHENYYNGLPTKRKLEKLTQDKGLSPSLHAFINEMKQVFTLECIHRDCHPEFAKQIMMKTLKKRGLQIAVCSNAIRKTIEVMLERGMLMPYIDLILSNQDVVKNKPDPEMYHTAMQHFAVAPEETIIVEDSPHGIEAARTSGAHVIVVRNATEVHLNIFSHHFPDL